jgi:tagaturonate reductase
MVSGGLLAGFTEVQELLADEKFRQRIESTLFDEILPTVALPEAEKRAFAESVLRRFANPFAHHKLEAIALNSVAKWKVRILPVILDSNVLPYYLTRSLGELYKRYILNNAAGDTAEVAARFNGSYSVDDFLADRELWEMDLHEIPGLAEAVREAAL